MPSIYHTDNAPSYMCELTDKWLLEEGLKSRTKVYLYVEHDGTDDIAVNREVEKYLRGQAREHMLVKQITNEALDLDFFVLFMYYH